VESSIEQLRKELHTFIRWGLGIQITVLLSLATLVAKAFLG
jgi:hypothetical protein